jgi:hypothetical protein
MMDSAAAMVDAVIYFPYMSVPESEWFSRVLLYWDEIGSIVPGSYARERRLSPYTQALADAELVRPVAPERFSWDLRPAMESFLRFVDQDEEIQRRRDRLGTDPARRGEAPAGTVVQVHEDKFGMMLAGELGQRGLIRRSGGHEWFEVESRTASFFMAHLATALGGLPDVGMRPISDHARQLAVFADASPESVELRQLIESLRLPVLEGVLPAPERPVDVRELATFKDEHGALLRRFRTRIEGELVDVALIPDEEARTVKLRRLQDELADEIDEVTARMRERAWPRLVFGTLCGVVAAAIPVVGAVASGAALGAAAALPAFVSAVYAAQAGTRPRAVLEREPLAYAALARERLL